MSLQRNVPPRARNRFSAETIANFTIFIELGLLMAVAAFGLYKPDFSTKVAVAFEFTLILGNAVIYVLFQAAGATRDPLEKREMKTDMMLSLVPFVAHAIALLFLFQGELRIPKGYDAEGIRLYYWWWAALMGSSFVVVITDVWFIGSQMYRVVQLTDDATIKIDPT